MLSLFKVHSFETEDKDGLFPFFSNFNYQKIDNNFKTESLYFNTHAGMKDNENSSQGLVHKLYES